MVGAPCRGHCGNRRILVLLGQKLCIHLRFITQQGYKCAFLGSGNVVVIGNHCKLLPGIRNLALHNILGGIVEVCEQACHVLPAESTTYNIGIQIHVLQERAKRIERIVEFRDTGIVEAKLELGTTLASVMEIQVLIVKQKYHGFVERALRVDDVLRLHVAAVTDLTEARKSIDGLPQGTDVALLGHIEDRIIIDVRQGGIHLRNLGFEVLQGSIHINRINVSILLHPMGGIERLRGRGRAQDGSLPIGSSIQHIRLFENPQVAGMVAACWLGHIHRGLSVNLVKQGARDVSLRPRVGATGLLIDSSLQTINTGNRSLGSIQPHIADVQVFQVIRCPCTCRVSGLHESVSLSIHLRPDGFYERPIGVLHKGGQRGIIGVLQLLERDRVRAGATIKGIGLVGHTSLRCFGGRNEDVFYAQLRNIIDNPGIPSDIDSSFPIDLVKDLRRHVLRHPTVVRVRRSSIVPVDVGLLAIIRTGIHPDVANVLLLGVIISPGSRGVGALIPCFCLLVNLGADVGQRAGIAIEERG